MAWSRPQFNVSINSLNKGLSNEGGLADANFVRFFHGLPQTLGGWQLHTTQTFPGTARGSHDWRTLEGKTAIAWGTENALFCEIAGMQMDVTPNLHDTVLENCFTTEDESSIVTVHLDYHRMKPGEPVTFRNHQSTIGGLTIEGTFDVVDVLSISQFTIDVGIDATSTETTPGGGYVDLKVRLPNGLASTPASGYGSGTYGEGGYGASADSTLELRSWSLANWGEFLLANPSGYPIFEFQPELRYDPLEYNGDFATNADGWALGTGLTWSGGEIVAAAGTASNLSQNVEDVFEGGRYYKAVIDMERTAGTLKLRMNTGAPTPAVIDIGTASSPMTKTGVFERVFLCPADPRDIVLEKDSAFAGKIKSVHYQLMDKAYRIVTSPARVDAMSIDPKGVVLAYGCSLVDGSYSATTIRCSDIGNNRAWVPDTDSMASEIPLNGVGGRLMCGLSTREQNIVWSDQNAIALEWKGAPGAAFEPFDLGSGIGIISRHAMAEHGGLVLWMTPGRQIRIFRGIGALSKGSAQLLKCPLHNEIFDNINERQKLKIHVGANPEFAEFWIFAPDTRDGDECSRVYAVSWAEGDQAGEPVWTKHKLARTSWRPSGTFPNPIGFGAPVDGLSRIFDHEVGYTANGQALNEFMETAPFDAGEGDQILMLRQIEPYFSHQTGNVGITVMGWMSQNGAPFEHPQLVATPDTEFLYTRYKARRMALRFEGLSAGGFWRYASLNFDLSPTGARR
jgi:hypothetical protein